ncbi:MAG: O-antigen ligase family protein [Verrucomicrobia bacterium]|nr:O-antigen ligase family protein [Verrucomicrobiota bacterium]
MPPAIALSLTLALICFLFWRDSRENSKVSSAVWIPLIWVFLTGSKFVSQWLTLSQPTYVMPDEGSPIDAAVFLGLIVAGLYVLRRRQVTLREFRKYNVWITIFLLYCLVSVIWSDFPFIAVKRWIKVVALPIMVLVVLTDPNRKEAICRLFKRSGYLLLLLSILFIKYFPQYGRGWDSWTGLAFNCGINNNKNELGYVCLIFGAFFFWNTLQALQIKDRRKKRTEVLLNAGFFALACWLLKLASSATSLVCLCVAILTICVLGLGFIDKRRVTIYVIAGVLALGAGEAFFGIYRSGLEVLGRDSTLTDRTQVWHDALQLQPDPILGAGFESFWLGRRLDLLWQKWWWRPNQAHNGYIETYLNLGYVGALLLGGLIIGTFRKTARALVTDFEFGRFRMAMLLAIVIYNFTEATFKGVHLVWLVFYLIAIDYPPRKPKMVRLSKTVPGFNRSRRLETAPGY